MSRHRIDRLQSYFLERPEVAVVSVYLFGSRSLGRHWDRLPGLAILADPGLYAGAEERAELLERIAPELSRTAEEPRLDLLMLNDAPPRTGRHIVTEGRRIVLNDPHLDRAFLRDVQIRAVDLDAYSRRPPRRVRVEAVAR